MGYELKLLAEDSVLLTIFHEDFNVSRDAPALMSEMKEILDQSSTPLYMMDDLTSLKMSFADLVSGLAMATRGEMGVARHPNVRKMVIVSTNELLRLGGSALKQSQYGGVQADIYPTVDAALQGIRKEMAASGN